MVCMPENAKLPCFHCYSPLIASNLYNSYGFCLAAKNVKLLQFTPAAFGENISCIHLYNLQAV